MGQIHKVSRSVVRVFFFVAGWSWLFSCGRWWTEYKQIHQLHFVLIQQQWREFVETQPIVTVTMKWFGGFGRKIEKKWKRNNSFYSSPTHKAAKRPLQICCRYLPRGQRFPLITSTEQQIQSMIHCSLLRNPQRVCKNICRMTGTAAESQLQRRPLCFRLFQLYSLWSDWTASGSIALNSQIKIFLPLPRIFTVFSLYHNSF